MQTDNIVTRIFSLFHRQWAGWALIRLACVVALGLASVLGCRKQAAADSESSDPSAPAVSSVVTPDAPSSGRSPALQKLAKNSGLVLSAGTRVLTHGDGGVPDPSVGFYEWVLWSALPLPLPEGRQADDKAVLSVPVAESVQYMEAKMNGAKIENPQAAFSTGWQTNGYQLSGTWIRAQNGDYVIVQQSRQR